MLIAEDVLKLDKSIDVKFKQLLNKPLIYLTEDVLNFEV